MVQDRKTKEWGFVSGGIKRNELPEQAATREVLEETSGILSTDTMVYLSSFVTSYRPQDLKVLDRKNREKVKSLYYVFLLKFDHANVSRFRPNKEVVNVRVAKYADFENVWSFCDDVYFQRISTIIN
jgi:8-oxo-dGTP pyrophosphatase MutT (NUDIX family)